MTMRAFKTQSTDIDRRFVWSHIWMLILGRITLRLEVATRAAVARDKELASWNALRAQAVAASDDHTVEWALEDLWAAGGTDWTARALLRRIIDGSFRPRW
ncbi:hypothetical protein [Sphingobium yanoikuyae]|uniref:Uncharacterized protein n=1 Tax=Sphingobium yanoikuyae TaxID=13690 RepID=A0A430BX23_SPHYA|nr:hypothetical protein [Sphingobium yanoikuyae]RSU57203.1 hypothetical protein DAH51_10345 [Sphingobium yanoikuyae]